MAEIQKALGFNVLAFGLEIVLFLILWTVMSSLFWKPIMAHLAQRAKDKADAYRHVDATERDMERLRADYMARITQIEAEARAQINAAVKQAQAERERILAEARAQTEATLRQGAADMEREKIESLQAMQDRLVGIAAGAIDKALGSAGDKAALRRVVQERVAQNTPTASSAPSAAQG